MPRALGSGAGRPPTRRSPSRSLALLVVGIALFAATGRIATAAAAPTPARSVAHVGGTEVGLARCALLDPTRSTENFSTGALTPGRRLLTEIRYPTRQGRAGTETAGAVPLIRPGGYPVIVFAEGYDVTPDAYRALLDAWVQAGFVVVAPIFPDTNPQAVAAQPDADPEDDNVNEPADLAFVTRQLLAASASTAPDCRVFHRLADPSELALAGQSDGGEVAAALAYDSADAAALGTLRFRAVAVLSGAQLGVGTYTSGGGAPPLLAVQSDADACNPPQDAVALYDAIPGVAKWFLVLHGAAHLPPYSGSDPAAFAVVSSVTSRWFRLEFAGATPAAGFLAFGNRTPAIARLTAGPAPALPTLEMEPAACYLR